MHPVNPHPLLRGAVETCGQWKFYWLLERSTKRRPSRCDPSALPLHHHIPQKRIWVWDRSMVDLFTAQLKKFLSVCVYFLIIMAWKESAYTFFFLLTLICQVFNQVLTSSSLRMTQWHHTGLYRNVAKSIFFGHGQATRICWWELFLVASHADVALQPRPPEPLYMEGFQQVLQERGFSQSTLLMSACIQRASSWLCQEMWVICDWYCAEGAFSICPYSADSTFLCLSLMREVSPYWQLRITPLPLVTSLFWTAWKELWKVLFFPRDLHFWMRCYLGALKPH